MSIDVYCVAGKIEENYGNDIIGLSSNERLSEQIQMDTVLR